MLGANERSDDELDLDVTPVRLVTGDKVLIQAYWGTERGTFVKYHRGGGDAFPSAEVLMDGGGTVTIDVARVTKEDSDV